MKAVLQGIMDQINQLPSSGEDEVLKIFRTRMKEAIVILEQGQAGVSGMGAIWCEMALKEIKMELNQRMSEQIFSQDVNKKKSELAYSKSLVSMALMNVLMNI